MEVMPGQAEFQIGPTVGVDAGDQLWIARYMYVICTYEFFVYSSWVMETWY